MEIVRKELYAGQVSPVNLRYNTGTGKVQSTADGGTTWVDASNQDPRHNPTALKPALTSGTAQCDAAATMKANVKAEFDAIISQLAAAAALGVIVTNILEALSVFGEYTIIFAVISEFISTLNASGSVALNVALTPTVYAQLLCILYCDISPDGQVTPNQLANIETDVTNQIGGLAATAINLYLSLTGEVGLSNIGVTSTITGTCTGCTGCEYCFFGDFRVANIGFGGAGTGIFGADQGRYIPGFGWLATDNGTQSYVGILMTLAGSGDAAIDKIEVTWDGPVTTGGGVVDQIATADHAHPSFSTTINNFTRTPVSGLTTYTVTPTGNFKFLLARSESNVTGSTRRLISVKLTWHAGANAPTLTPNCT